MKMEDLSRTHCLKYKISDFDIKIKKKRVVAHCCLQELYRAKDLHFHSALMTLDSSDCHF